MIECSRNILFNMRIVINGGSEEANCHNAGDIPFYFSIKYKKDNVFENFTSNTLSFLYSKKPLDYYLKAFYLAEKRGFEPRLGLLLLTV